MLDIYNYRVYIVRCKEGRKYYAGVTNDLDVDCQSTITVSILNVTLIKEDLYEEHFHDINQALAWKKQLKGWSRKRKRLYLEEMWKR